MLSKKLPKIKNCVHCNKEFAPTCTHHRFCSVDCGNTHRYLANKKSTWVPKTLDCPQCGTKFVQNSSNHKYCSRECSNTAMKNSYVRKTKKREKANCKHCGVEYKPRAQQVFCTVKCRLEHYKTVEMPESVAKIERNRWFIFNRDDFQCFYCGKSSVEDKSELHIDHVMPRSNGGSDSVSNLVTSCSECNVAKGALVFKEQKMQRLLKEIKDRNEKCGVNPNLTIKFY